MCTMRYFDGTDNTRCSLSCSWRADSPRGSFSRSTCRHPNISISEPRQARVLRLVMEPLFAVCAEIARVTGKMRASSDEFIAYANDLEIPRMDAGGRKLRLELAAQCVKEQAATLDDFALWHQRQERDLRASYTELGLTCPPAGTLPPAPQGVWTGSLVRCSRCRELHVPHRIVCCTLFELSAPQPLEEPVQEPASNRMMDDVSRFPEHVHVDIRGGTPMTGERDSRGPRRILTSKRARTQTPENRAELLASGEYRTGTERRAARLAI